MMNTRKACMCRYSQMKHVNYVIAVFQQPVNPILNHMHKVSSEHQELWSILCILAFQHVIKKLNQRILF